MNVFTTDDLLEFYYQESSPEKASRILIALKSDWALQQKFDVICSATDRLDKSFCKPRPQSVQRIVDYATRRTSEPVE